MMRALVRAIDGLSKFCGALAAVIVGVLVVLMLYDVVLRYAFNAPTSWGNDLNTFLGGGSFVLSLAYATATDSHVRVDLLYSERTRPRIRYFDLIGFIGIVLPVVCLITWGLWGHLMEAIRTGEHTGSGGWNPVVWPFRAVLFAGFLVFSIQIFAEILKRLAWLVGRPIETEAAKDHAV